MKTFLTLACAAMLGAAFAPTAATAQTDGTASFTVTLISIPLNYSPRVDAYWVTDAAGNFIMTLREDSASRANYLYQWNAAKAGDTYVDGFSGATISTWGTFTVTWDGRNKNNVLQPDGTYKFWVEMTDKNGQGPYTTNGIAFVKGAAGVTNTYPNAGDYITAMSVTYTVVHDVAVTQITPSIVAPNTNVTVSVTVTNKTGNAEAFSVVLSNLTSGTLIGTQNVASLAGSGVTTLNFPWTTPSVDGIYSLRATAGPVADETSTADNALTKSVSVETVPHDIAVTSLTPGLVPPGTNVTVSVVVTNETVTMESFSVVLSNLTTGSLIGTLPVSNMAGRTAVTLAFPWNTAGLFGDYQLQATAGPVSGEATNTVADNLLSRLVTVRPLVPDVAIVGVSAPGLVPPNNAANLTVLTANLGESTESFNVQMWDDTAQRFIGPMWQIPNLRPTASISLPLVFTTTNSAIGYHALRTVASRVPNEVTLPNNTNQISLMVAYGWSTNVLVTPGSAWRYNDQGLDLAATPWRATNYYDATWSAGAAPLGYSENGQMTNLTTVLSWGPVATNKYPTTYLRQSFIADWLPVSLTLNARCVDGTVFYLNGAELARFNMPTGTVAHGSLASSPVTGSAQYAWVSLSANPSNVVVGNNILAAEVHRADLSGSDLALDVQMTAVMPQVPANHDVAAVGLTTPGSVLAGDQMPVTVTVVNRGNVTENVLVLLKDGVTGQIVSSQILSGLPPGGTATAEMDWGTLGAQSGANQLVAYTVVGGVTNFAGAYTNIANVSGAVFIHNPAVALGAIGGRCSALAANGSLLLVGAGAALQVWDRSNPVMPVQIATVRLPGLIEHIAVSGSRAYAACGSAGVQCLDLTVPSQPVHRWTMNTSGHAYSVAASGSHLYVADGVSGLRIVDVSNPSAPSLAGVYYTAGPARAVTLVGGTAYLLDQHQGLLILNVSNPSAPSLLGSYAGFDAGRSLVASGSHAYVLDENNHFFVLNVASPTAPTLAGSLLLTNKVGQALGLNGGTIYAAVGADGLLVIDASTPSAPVLVSSIAMPGEAVGLALAGSKLYAADGLAGFQVFDVASPASPALQSNFAVGLRGNDVVVANDMIYVAAGESGLRTYCTANLSTPTLQSCFTGVSNARALAVAGTTAYVGDGQTGLKIVSVANPLSPLLLGAYTSTNLGSIRNVGVSGSLVVVSDGRTVLLLNASSPGSPSLIGSYRPPSFAFSLAVSGNKAYLACGNNGVVILSLSPGGLTLAGGYNGMAQYPTTDIAVSGTTAHVAYPGFGWATLNVANPASPVLINSFPAEGSVSAIAAAGSAVTLFTGWNTAVTLDATTPLTPVPQSAFGPLTRALRLAAAPGLALTAEDEAGLALLSTMPSLVLYVQPSPDKTTVTLRWPSVAGKTYSIYKSTDLNAGFFLLKDYIPGAPPTNTETDNMNSTAAFYVIGVR